MSVVVGLGLEHSCPWPREGLSSEGLSLVSDFFCIFASRLVYSTPPLHNTFHFNAFKIIYLFFLFSVCERAITNSFTDANDICSTLIFCPTRALHVKSFILTGNNTNKPFRHNIVVFYVKILFFVL